MLQDAGNCVVLIAKAMLTMMTSNYSHTRSHVVTGHVLLKNFKDKYITLNNI